MNINEIIIPNIFKTTVPRSTKMKKVRKHYRDHGDIDKPLVIHKNVLVDGYIRYLILKEVGATETDKVKILPNYRYLYGIHPNSPNTNEYCWKLPDTLEDINVGDYVLCWTKYGKAPVQVTRIEDLDEQPFKRMKKVICKLKEENKNE